MKKEVISVFDGETERKSTFAEKVGIFTFLLIVLPILLGILIIILLLLLMILNGGTS